MFVVKQKLKPETSQSRFHVHKDLDLFFSFKAMWMFHMDALETKCPKKLEKFETPSFLRTLCIRKKLFTNKVIGKTNVRT